MGAGNDQEVHRVNDRKALLRRDGKGRDALLSTPTISINDDCKRTYVSVECTGI